ncbi:toll/interleukin-1 receptor domain-containing protein [Flavobacterium orientale]|uniref:TIR domain-containing protein n=1 Tax=Flavobacterium orientale TaxID=1756020 RepID=A0A916Y026_9FLAO|nr:toll/interleukin-1 receptor domain-containing protein [Flavobacterium orientale]GGD24414.1 hypothetical protein GCM10011343_13230 [Flavobacterium orientale]
MHELLKETLKGYIELKLKTGESLVGKVPFDSPETDHFIFLPQQNFKKFYEKSNGNSVLFDNIREYVMYIPLSLVESYRVKLNVVKGLKTKNNRPLPNWIKFYFKNNGKLGFLNVKYSLPGSDKIFDLGYLKIEDDELIMLPITFVFLSYAKEDKEIVKQTMEVLHDYGVITWFDEKDLLPGDNWQDKIEQSIEKADYILIFFSSNSITRQGYKNKEIRFALEQKMLKPFDTRYIIPILIDDVTPPRELREIHWIKMNDENWINKVLVSIGKEPINI